MIKKIALLNIIVSVFLSIAAPALATDYLCNPRSMKFHYYGCRTIKHPENFIPMSSREEAINAGYKPCGVCKP